jgi:hypothetical protein
MGQPVVHWEIAARDARKLRDFYGKLFDWKITVDKNMGDYGLVETGGRGQGGIDGGIFPTRGDMPANLTFYIQVDDLQASLDKAVKLGGKALVPPTPIPNIGAFAMFSDPEGNAIGLFKG